MSSADSSKNDQETESVKSTENKFEVTVNILKQDNEVKENTSSSEQRVTNLFEKFQPSLLSLNKKMQSLSNQSIDISDNNNNDKNDDDRNDINKKNGNLDEVNRNPTELNEIEDNNHESKNKVELKNTTQVVSNNENKNETVKMATDAIVPIVITTPMTDSQKETANKKEQNTGTKTENKTMEIPKKSAGDLFNIYERTDVGTKDKEEYVSVQGEKDSVSTSIIKEDEGLHISNGVEKKCTKDAKTIHPVSEEKEEGEVEEDEDEEDEEEREEEEEDGEEEEKNGEEEEASFETMDDEERQELEQEEEEQEEEEEEEEQEEEEEEEGMEGVEVVSDRNRRSEHNAVCSDSNIDTRRRIIEVESSDDEGPTNGMFFDEWENDDDAGYNYVHLTEEEFFNIVEEVCAFLPLLIYFIKFFRFLIRLLLFSAYF